VRSTTIPPLRVSQELRRQVEEVLDDGETLSSFMLRALEQSVAQRRDQQAFIARGLTSASRARRTGAYVDADAVLAGLEARLTRAKNASSPAKPRSVKRR